MLERTELAQRLSAIVRDISPVEFSQQAHDEASRLIDRLCLIHPVTMGAALKIVSEETTIGQWSLVKETAGVRMSDREKVLLATVVDLLPDEVEFLKFHGISNREYAKHLIAKRKSRDDALMEKLYGDMKEQGKRND